MALSRRPAIPADHALAREFHHGAYRDVVERQFGSWDEQQQDAFFDGAWSRNEAEMIEWDGEVCGYTTILTGAVEVTVQELVIGPTHQGLGIGTAVLGQTIARADELGLPVELQVLNQNRAAALYQRLGFEEYDRNETHRLMRHRPSVGSSGAAGDGLVTSLAALNDAVLAKLDGLGQYDLRRPLTSTGTNLLGIVKHLATVQAGYFGDVFDRPWPEPMPWIGAGAAINEDLFASQEESSDGVLSFYRRSWAHATETFAVTDLEATGTVPWWPEERRHPTLRAILVHMTVETARHAGHLDIVRELIDGQAGRFAGDPSLPGPDEIDWPAHVETVEGAARAAATGPGTNRSDR